MNAVEILSVAGTLVTVFGFGITVWQLKKTRSAAEAAANSARATREVLAARVALADLAACTTIIDEVKALVRRNSAEAALLRVADITRLLLQLQAARRVSGADLGSEFKRFLTQLSVLRSLLERHLQGKADLKPVQVNATLSNLSDGMNALIGDLKYQDTGGASR